AGREGLAMDGPGAAREPGRIVESREPREERDRRPRYRRRRNLHRWGAPGGEPGPGTAALQTERADRQEGRTRHPVRRLSLRERPEGQGQRRAELPLPREMGRAGPFSRLSVD